MPLHLRPATASDAPAMTSVWLAAFANDTIIIKCFPTLSSQVHNFWLSSILEEMAAPYAHFFVVVNVDPSSPDTETVIAYAKWNGPDAEPSLKLPQWPTDGDSALADNFFGQLAHEHIRAMGVGEERTRHWYLELLATHPEWQGKGAGGKLLRKGLEMADAEGLPAYVESSPTGRAVYSHLGFVEVGRVVLLDGEYVELIMVRHSRVVE